MTTSRRAHRAYNVNLLFQYPDDDDDDDDNNNHDNDYDTDDAASCVRICGQNFNAFMYYQTRRNTT